MRSSSTCRSDEWTMTMSRSVALKLIIRNPKRRPRERGDPLFRRTLPREHGSLLSQGRGVLAYRPGGRKCEKRRSRVALEIDALVDRQAEEVAAQAVEPEFDGAERAPIRGRRECASGATSSSPRWRCRCRSCRRNRSGRGRRRARSAPPAHGWRRLPPRRLGHRFGAVAGHLPVDRTPRHRRARRDRAPRCRGGTRARRRAAARGAPRSGRR